MIRRVLVVLALLSLACTASDSVTITLTAASAPPGTGIFVEIDAVPTTQGHPAFKVFPLERVVKAPFTYTIEVQPGALLHATIKVHATEPDQIVGCQILRNGALIPGTEGAGTFSRPAICTSPPA